MNRLDACSQEWGTMIGAEAGIVSEGIAHVADNLGDPLSFLHRTEIDHSLLFTRRQSV